jgi:hypothetical protein
MSAAGSLALLRRVSMKKVTVAKEVLRLIGDVPNGQVSASVGGIQFGPIRLCAIESSRVIIGRLGPTQHHPLLDRILLVPGLA